jgi:hypothetical protein
MGCAVDEPCDHKFVDSKHCLKCGWTPPTAEEVERRAKLEGDVRRLAALVEEKQRESFAKKLRSARAEGKREGLEEAARWLDAEYAYLAAVSPHDTSDAGSQNVGMRAACAEFAALLRQWAATGKAPEHRRVKERIRALKDANG